MFRGCLLNAADDYGHRLVSSITGLFSAKDRDKGHRSCVAGDQRLDQMNWQREMFQCPSTPPGEWNPAPAFTDLADRNVGNVHKNCLSPWWGSNLACIPKLWGHIGKAPCGPQELVCHSHRTTRWRTTRWPARSEWTAGRRTGRYRWVLRREGICGVSSSFANKSTISFWPDTTHFLLWLSWHSFHQHGSHVTWIPTVVTSSHQLPREVEIESNWWMAEGFP